MTSLVLSFAPQVFAAVGTDGGTGSGTAISKTQTECSTTNTTVPAAAATGGVNSIAVGCGAVSAGTGSIAIGGTATTVTPSGTPANPIPQGTQSVAIGYDAQVQGDQSVGLGANVRATGNSSIAIGGDDLNKVVGTTAATTYTSLTGDTIVLNDYRNTTTSTAAVAVGVQSQATGDLSTAFGTRTKATGSSSTALGVGADASKDGAVALGAGSLTDIAATKVENATVNSVNFTGFVGTAGFAGANNDGRQVSVGSIGHERQIKNVAPGAISATSTDAINGSQIYAVSSKLIDNIKTAQTTADQGINITTNKTGTGTVTGTSTAKVGSGETATFTAGNNVAITQNGKEVQIAVAASPEFTSVKTGNTTLDGGGVTLTDGKGSIHRLTTATAIINNATGSNISTATNNVLVNNITGATTISTAGSSVYADGKGNTTVVDQTGLSFTNTNGATGPSITAGGIDAGNTRITNVADAVDLDDAVTLGQALDVAESLGTSVADNLGGGSKYDTTTNTVTAPTYTLDNGTNTGTTADFNNVGDALGNLDGRTTTNTADIADLTSNLNNGTIGIVQQATNTAAITVGKGSLGTSVDFANANGEARQLTNVAAGVAYTDAASMQQLKDLTTALGGNVDPNTGVIIAPEYNVNNYSIDPNTGVLVTTPSVVNNVGDAIDSMGSQINNLQTSSIGLNTSVPTLRSLML